MVKIKIKSSNDITKATDHFNKVLYEVSMTEAELIAKQVRKEIRRDILRQRKKWKPLVSAYKKYKKQQGYDTRIYIMTKEFLNSIVVIKGKTGYYVGMKPGNHSKANIDYGLLAAILEFGSESRNIPARPLWRAAIRRKRKKHFINTKLRFLD